MDWKGIGLSGRVKDWLEAASGERYVRDRRMDPFATSMRDFDDVSPNLKTVRDGNAPSVNDSAQRIVDLRAAGLLSSSGKELSSLGEASLAAWEHYGVDSAVKGDELARLLIFVAEGKRLGDATILDHLEYWADLRNHFAPLELIENWDSLYVLNYLDVERNGFRPGDAYRDSSTPPADIEFDLTEFVANEHLGQTAQNGAERIQNGIGGRIPRGRHRATIAMAFEIVTSNHVPSSLLNDFGSPKKPRTWTPFTEAQKKKILAIAADYGMSGAPAIQITEQGEQAVPVSTEPALPAQIDFEHVLVGSPKGKEAASSGGGNKTVKRDYIRKAERDTHVGKLGEEFAIQYEQWRLRNRPDLLAKLRHVSLNDDSVGYDIESFELDGSPRFVEVKATLGPLETRFFISANELKIATENAQSYVILRVGNLATAPVCCEERHPFQNIDLVAALYEATFKPGP